MRTYIPGDICPHNVRTMSAQHLPRETYIFREMLCGHIADIVRTNISRDICPYNVITISFFGFHLQIYLNEENVGEANDILDVQKRPASEGQK